MRAQESIQANKPAPAAIFQREDDALSTPLLYIPAELRWSYCRHHHIV